MTVFFMALAGSLGAVSRFVVDGHIRMRSARTFPWATIVINVTGSVLLGFVTGLSIQHRGMTSLTTIIGAGFCGGYTTFSTAAFETVRLLERRRRRAALFNTIGSLIMTLAGAGVGIALGRL